MEPHRACHNPYKQTHHPDRRHGHRRKQATPDGVDKTISLLPSGIYMCPVSQTHHTQNPGAKQEFICGPGKAQGWEEGVDGSVWTKLKCITGERQDIPMCPCCVHMRSPGGMCVNGCVRPCLCVIGGLWDLRRKRY